MKSWKGLINKAREDKYPFLGLLDWRNILSEDIGTSPVQRFMGIRTLLPTTDTLLRPEIPQSRGEKVTTIKEAQTKYYNRNANKLSELHVGDNIRIRLPGDLRWSLGQCRCVLGHRSYEVCTIQ